MGTAAGLFLCLVCACSFIYLTGGCHQRTDPCSQLGNIRFYPQAHATSTQGVVEMCHNYNYVYAWRWGAIADDGTWTDDDARVVCRQLGLPISGATTMSFPSVLYYNDWCRYVYRSTYACTGSEQRLIDCSSSFYQTHIYYTNTYGVRCGNGATCSTHGSVRLVGSTSQQGTVEVCINNNWGTVCDSGWSAVDANIVCRQLGYSNADAIARANAYYGQGSGSTSLSYVGCLGSELRLIDCSYSSSSSGCSHSDDAGVQCQSRCTHGSARIVGGSLSQEGRVEVCLNGLWGTVCDDFWSQTDANVVCWQLGYSNADAIVYLSAYFGQGIIPILITNVDCSGMETRLVDCSYSTSTGGCYHYEDAGIRCQHRCTHGDVRVIGGSNNMEGRVEVCVNGAWGTVCDDSWSQEDANIICRQLGYSNSDATPLYTAYFGQGIVPILLDDVSCSGSESQLISCTYDSNTADCSHSKDAGVRCQTACTHGTVRLRGSSLSYQGRVEVCVSGVWGSVCDDLWDINDAKVACRKVGYPIPNPTAYANAAFGQASLPILLDDVACSGSELTLTSCSYDSTPNCVHAEDAGIKCQHVPSNLTVGTALTSSLGYGSIKYYQYYFPSNGITITLYVGTGTVNCYASDRFQNPNEERYDWKIVVIGYSDVFIDPNLLARTPGSNIYIGLQGVGSSNTFTLGSTTGDTRAPHVLSSDTGVSDTLSANERTYYEFEFSSNGITLRLSVTSGTIICYASDLIQNPNEQQGYVWKVTATDYIDVFLDPDSLTRTVGSTLYVGLEGADLSNNFSLNSTTGDRRLPERYEVDEEILGSLQSNELEYYELEFPSGGITFTLIVDVGYITCYASDNVQNPNEEQGYEWKVETNSSVEVFLDPASLDRGVGMYVYIGLEGGYSINNFSLNSTSGDRRTPAMVATNTTSTGTVRKGERIYYRFTFLTSGVTITLNVIGGFVVCYASDRYRNPNEAQGYDWRIEVGGYADVYLDPSLLSRTPGATLYVAIEGVNTSNHFTLGNTEGDRRVPTATNIGEGVTATVDQNKRLFYRLAFPSDGLTIRLSALSGRVVCYASDRLTNPTSTQGYDWRVETDDYTDVFIDPILLGRSRGQYIYLAIEGLHASNTFLLNSTQGDHRVPFDATIGSSIMSTLAYQEVVYYRFSFPTTGLTLVLDVSYGSVVCYASDSIQNPNRKHGYSLRVEASYYNDSYIDPAVVQGAVGGYLFVGIEGRSNASNNSFSLNGTAGDSATRVPDPPHGVQSLTITAMSAKIAWEAPVSYVDTPISDVEYYELMVYENQHNLPTVLVNTTELNYVLSGLEEFVNYTCEIAAVNRVGQGQYSAAFIFLTLQAASSGPPQNITGTAISATLVSLQWGIPVAIDINGVIAKYAVNIVEVYTGQSYSLFTENMHVNVGPLHPYYIYECSIAAYTVATGVYSSPINVTTLEAAPTGPPVNVTDKEIGSRTVLLSWQPPEFELQNGRIREYIIRVTHSRTGLTYTISTSSYQHLLQNLFPFHTYIFEVAAKTVGLGPYSSQLIVTLLEDAPDAAPVSVNGYAINATSIFLGWEPPPNDTHNGIIRSYQINCTEVDTGESFSVMSVPTEAILVDLHPAYMYTCKVSAVTVESGVFSGNITVLTEDAAPSGSPLALTVDLVLSRSIHLSWDLPLAEHRNGNITGFTVTVRNTDTDETNDLSTTYTALTVEALKPYMNYQLSVAASTVAGLGPYTQKVSVMTAEDVPYEPQSPSNQQIRGSPNELYFSWNPPLEPNGIITSYKVYCIVAEEDGTGGGSSNDDINSLNTTAVVPGIFSEAIVGGLTPYTIYNCYVTANTSVGEGNASSGARARTDESIPDTPPESLSAMEIDANSLLVTWSDPFIPHGIITSYSVQYNISADNITSFTTEAQYATLAGLDEYRVYAVSVAASTRVGSGPYALVYGRTGQAEPHSSPTSIQIPSTTEKSATITWQPPIPEDRNGVITYYLIIIRNLQFNIDDITVNVSGSDLRYTAQGLEEYCRYDSQIAAGTIIGTGPFSSRVQFLTMEDAPSAPPQNLLGSAQSSTIIDLTWSAPPEVDINGVVQHYSVKVVESETGRSWSFVHVEPEISVGSLHPYYNYECKVAAYTVGLGPYSNITSITTNEAVPISAPLGLRVTEVGSHSMTLNWEQPPLEHRNGRIRQYQVQLIEIETSDILQLSSESTQVNVTNLHPFYNYNCSVAAETINVGPFSDYLPVQLDEYGPSDAPINVAGQVIDSTAITLSWSPPPHESQNGIIRKYIIAATETNTGNEYTWESVATYIDIHSLHPFYTYQFTVAAYTVQQGPFSYIVTLQTSEDVPSAAPRNVIIEGLRSRIFNINWQPPVDEDQNGLITHYTVYVGNLETEVVTLQNATDTDIIVSDLTPFTTYEINIAAHTSAGRGPFSVIQTVQTLEAAPNTSPRNFRASVVNSMSLHLSWTSLPTEDRNGVIREYYVNITEVDTEQLLTYTTTNLFIVVGSLHPFYTYQCRVSAFTVATGPFSNASVVSLPEDVPTGYPQDFGILPTTPRSVFIKWEPPLIEDQNGIITEYTIRRGAIEYITNTTNLTIADLSPHTAYAWRIAASTSVGIGPFSTTVNVIMPEDAPTGSPRNLSGISTSAQNIYLMWIPPPVTLTNGVIREYYINITDVQTGHMQQLSTRSEYIEVTNLHPYYSYEVSVSAYTVALGPFSEQFIIHTLEYVPSGTPLNVVADVTGARMISVQWDPPQLQEQNGDITGYRVSIIPIISGEILDYETSEHSLVVEGLLPHTTYECIVAAMTIVGTGPFSGIVTVTTLEEAPSGRPSNSSGISLNATHIYLTWDPPPLNQTHGDIQGYRITIVEYESDNTTLYTSNTTDLVAGPLHPYYTYHCSIQAVTVEPGPPIIIIVRTHEAAPSSPPTSFEATAINTTTIFLSWRPPPLQYQNGIIRQYVVELHTSVTDSTITLVASGGQRNLTATNLRPYTLYECTVAAETVFIGVSSSIQLARTHETAPSAPPGEVFVLVANPTAVQIEWYPPREEDRNGVIQIYIINITEFDTGDSWQLTVEDDTDAFIPSLHPFYSYSFSVAAQTIALGPFTTPMIVEMPEDAPSSPPRAVSIEGVTDVSLTLFWDHPPEMDWNGLIRHFVVNVTEENTGLQYTLTTTANYTEINILHPFYTYFCSVAAVTISTGPYSHPLSVITLPAAPTGPPQSIFAPAVDASFITLMWDPPVAPEQNGHITNYTINMTTESGNIFSFSTSSNVYTISDLEPFKVYYFELAAETIVGQGPFSSSIPIRTGETDPTASPDHLTIAGIGSNYAELRWTEPDASEHNGVIRFYIVSITEEDTGNNYTLKSISTQLTATELHPFYTYNVTVAAVTISPGPFSNHLSFSTLQDVPSAAPESVEGQALGPRSLLLTWQPPPADQLNGILTGYIVNVTETETGTGNQYQIPADVTQFTFQGLHPFYRYTFIVAAVTVGQGPFSGIFSQQMSQDAPSASPVTVEATVFNSSALSIKWRPPPFEHQNGIIVGYTIRLLENVTENIYVTETDGPHTEIFITSLHPYYIYEFTVAAKTVYAGPYSAPDLIQMDEDVPSGAPVNITATPIDSMTIAVTWMPPLPQNRNGIIRQYSIDYYISETRQNIFKQLSDNSLSTIITDLHPYYTYSFKVAAVTIGAGPQSVEVIARTLESEPTGVPQSFEAVAVSSTSIRLTWNPPLVEEQNGVIRSYHINVSAFEEEEMVSFEADGLSTLFILNSLHPYYLYNITIAAFTVGLGPWVTVEERTHPEVPTGAPEHLMVMALNSSTVQVTWGPPQPHTQNGPINGYILLIVGINSDEETELFVGQSGLDLTVLSLHPFYTYTYTIAALSTNGVGPYSSPLSLQMPEEVCRATVKNVTVEVGSSSSVTVSWFPPDVQSWNGVITQYTVIYQLIRKVDDDSIIEPTYTQSVLIQEPGMSNNPDPRVATLPLKTESVVIGQLEEFYVYRFTVFLANSAGKSDVSNPIFIDMPPSAPSGPPTSVTALALSSTSILITWHNPGDFDINGVLTAFEIFLSVDSTSNVRQFIQPASTFSLHLEGLKKFAQYSVTVTAINSEGKGPSSEAVSIRTLEDVPSAPLDASAEVVNSTAISLKWSPPLSPNGHILYYTITYYGYKPPEYDSYVAGKNTSIAVIETMATLTNLQPGLMYSIEIRANTSAGFGEAVTVTYLLEDKIDVSETGKDDRNTPVIIVAAIVAGLAAVVLVLIVTVWLWRHIKRSPMKLYGLHFSNPLAKTEDESDADLHLTSYKLSNDQSDQLSDDRKVDLDSDSTVECEDSQINADSNM